MAGRATVVLDTTKPSTPKRTGQRLASALASASALNSKKLRPARTRRNSGSQRPAWRIAHTGGRSTASPRAARNSKWSAAGIGRFASG